MLLIEQSTMLRKQLDRQKHLKRLLEKDKKRNKKQLKNWSVNV
jgi:hypothetical protein